MNVVMINTFTDVHIFQRGITSLFGNYFAAWELLFYFGINDFFRNYLLNIELLLSDLPLEFDGLCNSCINKSLRKSALNKSVNELLLMRKHKNSNSILCRFSIESIYFLIISFYSILSHCENWCPTSEIEMGNRLKLLLSFWQCQFFRLLTPTEPV